MYINIKNNFIFNFFPNIEERELEINKVFSIVKFLKIYEFYYQTSLFLQYNFKNIICVLKYNNTNWLILDENFNYFDINLLEKKIIEKISDNNDEYDEYIINIVREIII
jgi:hypothetical protein